MSERRRGQIDIAPSNSNDVEYRRVPLKEELVQVRTSDLRHLKRDINAIPDSYDSDDGAFWTCVGFAVGAIPTCLASVFSTGQSLPVTICSWCICVLGIAGAAYFGIKAHGLKIGSLKLGGSDRKGLRQEAIDRIVENIDDFTSSKAVEIDDEAIRRGWEFVKSISPLTIRVPRTENDS